MYLQIHIYIERKCVLGNPLVSLRIFGEVSREMTLTAGGDVELLQYLHFEI